MLMRHLQRQENSHNERDTGATGKVGLQHLARKKQFCEESLAKLRKQVCGGKNLGCHIESSLRRCAATWVLELVGGFLVYFASLLQSAETQHCCTLRTCNGKTAQLADRTASRSKASVCRVMASDKGRSSDSSMEGVDEMTATVGSSVWVKAIEEHDYDRLFQLRKVCAHVPLPPLRSQGSGGFLAHCGMQHSSTGYNNLFPRIFANWKCRRC